MAIGLNFLVMILGLLLFVSKPPEGVWREVGRLMFFAGLFAILLSGDKVIALVLGH